MQTIPPSAEPATTVQTPAPTPAQALAASALADLTAKGLEFTRVVTNLATLEDRAVTAAARGLRSEYAEPKSITEATLIGQSIDAATAALAEATPRVKTLANCFEGLSRAIRRILALAARIEKGWPRPYALSDNRRTLQLRQAVRATRERIRAHTDGDHEAAERYFDDLDDHLEDPAFDDDDFFANPVEEMVRILCKAISLYPDAETRRVGFSPPTQAKTCTASNKEDSS